MKADDKVEYDGVKEKYTKFEELCKRVEVLVKAVDKHAEILRDNKLVLTEETEAPYFDDNEVYCELENRE